MNFHGGDVHKYNRNIFDFSSNINPLGVPESFKKALMERMEDFTRYPDINYVRLRERLSDYLEIGDPDIILPGNGAVELIYRLISVLPCETVVSVSPTFSEYGRAAVQNGKRFIEQCVFTADFQSIDFERLLGSIESYSAVVICNPNNPTGTLTAKQQLCDFAERLAEKNCWLIMDEAFIEFTDGYPSNSMVTETDKFQNLAVVRAATKFFGMPGIRLGYAVCSNKNISIAVKNMLEPWNVNTAAVIAADTVLVDHTYIKETRNWLEAERTFLYESLGKLEGIKVIKSSANFHLIEILDMNIDAWKLKSLLIQKGVLIRTPDGFNNLTGQHARLAVKDRESNKALISALKEVFYGE